MSKVIASPSVRALAARKGIDLDDLATRLNRQTLGREDIEGSGAVVAPASQPASGAAYWDVDHTQYGPVTAEPMPRIAQIASRNLAAAHSLIPSVTHHDDADIGRVETFRKSLKGEAAARGVKLTTLAFHLCALASCLKAFPRFNASLSSDEKTLFIKNFVHIGLAVDTPHGLMVPVIRDVDRKGLFELAGEITDLATRAQARKLPPEDMGGASMTISNLGGIGGTGFTPIVNPPELAILGITRTRISPVWDGEVFQARPLVPLDLTYDHRVINGADAARFLAHYAKVLAEPSRLLI